jgi:class 3 adenylate cyclase
VVSPAPRAPELRPQAPGGEDPHPRSALEGEDKPVTVLFADLRGSMELLAEGFMAVTPLGPVPVKGRTAAIELYELTGAPPHRSRLVTAAAPRL